MGKALVRDTETVKAAKQVIEWSRNACFSTQQPVRKWCEHARRVEYHGCVLSLSVCERYVNALCLVRILVVVHKVMDVFLL